MFNAFGTASLTSLPTEKQALRLLELAFDKGIRRFDTAPAYGNGYSEKILGKFARSRQSSVLLTTKFGLGLGSVGWLPSSLALPLNFLAKKMLRPSLEHTVASQTPATLLRSRIITRAHIEQGVARSLKRLQVDRIAALLLHEGIPSFLDEDAQHYLQSLKRSGVISQLGIAVNRQALSNLPQQQLDDWDILQYEGDQLDVVAEINRKFPDKNHRLHSLWRLFVAQGEEAQKSKTTPQIAAEYLDRIAAINPNCEIVFSSRQPKRLLENLRLFQPCH